MKNLPFVVMIAGLGLAGCAAPQGAGFSGIGSEPAIADSPSVLSGGTGYRAGSQAVPSYRQTYVHGATAAATSSRVAQSVLKRNGIPASVMEGRSKAAAQREGFRSYGGAQGTWLWIVPLGRKTHRPACCRTEHCPAQGCYR